MVFSSIRIGEEVMMPDEPKKVRKVVRRRGRKGKVGRPAGKKVQKVTLLIPDVNKLSKTELHFIATYKE